MTHTLPLPDFTHERVEVTTGPRSGLVITDDGGQLSRATVSISSGFTAGDTLSATVGASGSEQRSGGEDRASTSTARLSARSPRARSWASPVAAIAIDRKSVV